MNKKRRHRKPCMHECPTDCGTTFGTDFGTVFQHVSKSFTEKCEECVPECLPKKRDVLKIADSCIVCLGCDFFLLVEIESTCCGAEFEQIFAIKLCEEQAKKLIKCGIKVCNICNEEPDEKRHCGCVEFRCVIILKGCAFRVFVIDDEEIILVPTELCTTCGD